VASTLPVLRFTSALGHTTIIIAGGDGRAGTAIILLSTATIRIIPLTVGTTHQGWRTRTTSTIPGGPDRMAGVHLMADMADMVVTVAMADTVTM
jgi:hypothetical protein